MNIQLKILNKEFYNEEIDGVNINNIPRYATAGSAAIDLVCTEDVCIAPQERKQIKTGIELWIGSGGVNSYAGLIIPRSGLGSKGLILSNSVGLIDADYQGELLVNIFNSNTSVGWEDWLGTEPYKASENTMTLKKGDRFAQLVIIPVVRANFDVVEEFLASTCRNNRGFGSTGK